MYGDTEALTNDQLTSTVTVGTNGVASCQGDFGVDGTVTIAADWSTCGVTPSHSAPYILYDATVAATSPMYTSTNTDGEEVQVWLTQTQPFNIRCSYPDTAEVSTNAGITVPELAAFGTVEASGSAWDSSFSMTANTDSGYSQEIGINGNSVTLGDPIYMSISASLPSGLEFYIEYCRAAPDSLSTTSYVDLFRDYECNYDIFEITSDRTFGQVQNPYRKYFHKILISILRMKILKIF